MKDLVYVDGRPAPPQPKNKWPNLTPEEKQAELHKNAVQLLINLMDPMLPEEQQRVRLRFQNQTIEEIEEYTDKIRQVRQRVQRQSASDQNKKKEFNLFTDVANAVTVDGDASIGVNEANFNRMCEALAYWGLTFTADNVRYILTTEGGFAPNSNVADLRREKQEQLSAADKSQREQIIKSVRKYFDRVGGPDVFEAKKWITDPSTPIQDIRARIALCEEIAHASFGVNADVEAREFVKFLMSKVENIEHLRERAARLQAGQNLRGKSFAELRAIVRGNK